MGNDADKRCSVVPNQDKPEENHQTLCSAFSQSIRHTDMEQNIPVFTLEAGKSCPIF